MKIMKNHETQFIIAKPLFANLDAAGAKHLYFLIQEEARRAHSRVCAPVWGGAAQLGGLPSLKTRHRAADQSCLGARGSLRHDRRAARASCCGPKLTIRVSEGACAVACTAKSDNLPGPGPLDLGAGQVSATGRRGSHGPRRHAAAQCCCATDGRQAQWGFRVFAGVLPPRALCGVVQHGRRYHYTRRACNVTGPGVASGPGVVFCPTARSRGHRLTSGTPSGRCQRSWHRRDCARKVGRSTDSLWRRASFPTCQSIRLWSPRKQRGPAMPRYP